MRKSIAVTRRTVLVAAGATTIGGLALYGCGPSGGTPIQVYKDAGCGCCKVWVRKLQVAGYATTAEDRDDLQGLKKQLGVPHDLASCHTATVDRYVIEGHVPPADIKRLLAEKPSGLGLAVPGMPIGSPGMEVEGEAPEAYTVWLFQKSGERTPFAQHDG